ncbi:MAG TPA: 16S rRNA (cytosine(967)-C(5))-methyltransferase RsmB [Chthoniobacterales bacterium]|nr:16S rRNA (cytosine(967)-C(5))-methyltransferase RsmB [Chthoniobacterales bacterium]
MAQTSARRVSLAALRTWRRRKQFADAVISSALSKTALQPADRAFAVELFYGVLRNVTLLDFWIRLLRRGHVDVDLRDLLRLGLYQIFIAKTPEHAAVYETVEIAPKGQRAIVNAVLRSAARGRQELQEKANSQPLDVRASHPKFLIERWEKRFGANATEVLCAWNNQPPPIYARINRLKIDRESFLERYRNARTVPNVSNFVELSSPADAVDQGDCYVQDPSTSIACELLQPKPGGKILDACAAPGGKTAYVAELMENRGLIVGCDREPARLNLLDENLTRLGVRIAEIVCHDWTKPIIPQEILSEAPFDRILIDAPCSNTGVMRRRVDARWRLRPTDFNRMQTRQIQIARAVFPLLKPEGILVYSTCSVEVEENEDVVQQLLGQMSILQVEEEKRSIPFQDNFDGAFAARLRRTD